MTTVTPNIFKNYNNNPASNAILKKHAKVHSRISTSDIKIIIVLLMTGTGDRCTLVTPLRGLNKSSSTNLKS